MPSPLPDTTPNAAPKVSAPEYLRLRRTFGWPVLAVIIAGLPFLANQHLLAVSILAVIAVGYNACLYLPLFYKQEVLFRKSSILVTDTLLMLLLLAFSNGGASSPYTSLLLFPVISSALWYGARAAAIVGSLETIAVFLGLLAGGSNVDWPKAIEEFGFRMVFFVLIGTYVSWLTQEDRKERKVLAEKDMQINQERQQLLSLINNMADAVLVVDETGNIGLFNDATAKLVGSQYALVGKPFKEIFPLVDVGNKAIDLLGGIKTEAVRRRDLSLPMPDGSKLNIEADISPYIVNQKSRGFIVILRDITKEKTLEEQQEEFISVASHELRTPLAIAEANLSNTMSSPDLPPNVAIRDPLKQAHNNIIFLSNIIDDLTTLAFAEQEALNIDLKPVLPQELVQEIVHEHAHAARAKGLQLVVANATNVRPILTSSYRIKQVLQNYVTNAIKYSDSGIITVSVDNARQEHDGVIFCVRDTGIGIPISDQKKIFTKFFRSEEFRTRKYGGTGLGLYICARLAKRLRGKVWFESELKKGSTFYLQVPPYNQDRD